MQFPQVSSRRMPDPEPEAKSPTISKSADGFSPTLYAVKALGLATLFVTVISGSAVLAMKSALNVRDVRVTA